MTDHSMTIFKKRDFGEFISTPITFFIQEFKLISQALLFFVVPFIALELILIYVFDISNEQQNFNDILFNENSNQNLGETLLIRIVGMFQNVMLYTVLAVYVKVYRDKGKGNFMISDLRQGIKRVFWPVFGGQLLAGIIIVIGLFLLLIPGIYLAVVLSLIFAVIVFEEDKIGSSISRCFDIMKGKWWTAFGAFLVMGLIIIFALFILAAAVGLIFSAVGTDETISIISVLLISLITVLLLSIAVLLPVFLYASFVTEKENPELMDRIHDISSVSKTDANISDLFEKKTDKDEKNEHPTDAEKETPSTENEDNRYKPK